MSTVITYATTDMLRRQVSEIVGTLGEVVGSINALEEIIRRPVSEDKDSVDFAGELFEAGFVCDVLVERAVHLRKQIDNLHADAVRPAKKAPAKRSAKKGGARK